MALGTKVAKISAIHRILAERALGPGATAALLDEVEGVQPSFGEVSIWRFVDRVNRVSVKDGTPTANPNLWDWSPAQDAAVEFCKQNAQAKLTSTNPDGTKFDIYKGLPKLVYPYAQEYNFSRTHSVDHVRSFVLEGQGSYATVLKTTHGGPVFFVNRASHVSFRSMRGKGALKEGSTFVTFAQTQGENDSIPTYTHSFYDVDVEEMHRAYRMAGDIMGDRILWVNPGIINCLVGWRYENVNAVNHQIIGGEVQCFNDPVYGGTVGVGTHAAWNERMSAANGWTNPQTVRDGKVLSLRRGGDVTHVGGSFILPGTTDFFEYEEGFVQTVNVRRYGGRWEHRYKATDGVPESRDEWGQDKSAILRRSSPNASPDANVRPDVLYDSPYVLANYAGGSGSEQTDAGCDLFYLYNAMGLDLRDARILGGGPYKIKEMVGPVTQNQRGAARGRVRGNLVRERVVVGSAGSRVNHDVDVEVLSSQAGSAPNQASSLKTRVPLKLYPNGRASWFGPNEELLGTPNQPNAVVFFLPAGFPIEEIGGIKRGGDATAINYRFTNSTGAQAIGDVSLGALNAPVVKRPELLVPDNGQVHLTCLNPQALAMTGELWIRLGT